MTSYSRAGSSTPNYCPVCPPTEKTSVYLFSITEADASIGQYDDENIYKCVVGHEFIWVISISEVNNAIGPFVSNPDRDAKRHLMDKVVEVMGGLPVPSLGQILRMLSHPDIIEDTKRYFNTMDKASMCTRYEAPWSCFREAEAMYDNIQEGWLGAGSNGIGLAAWWCDNCRKRVTE